MKPIFGELSTKPGGDNEFIYALRCPVGGMIRYVGRTSQSLKSRLNMHLNQLVSKKQPNLELLYWKQELHSEGLQPAIELLEEVSRLDTWCAERKWTRHFQRLGSPLLNIRNMVHVEVHQGHNLYELNDIADKHNMDPLAIAVATRAGIPAISGFLSGSKRVEPTTVEIIVKFLRSLPEERLIDGPMHDVYRPYYLHNLLKNL